MNTNDMVTGPPDTHESLNELFREVFALIDSEIESISEDQVEARLHDLLDAHGYQSDSKPRPASAWDEHARRSPSEPKFVEIVASDRLTPAPEWMSVCREIRAARREAAKIIDSARREAEFLTVAAQAEAHRIKLMADEYLDAAVLRAAQIVADASEEVDRITAETRCVTAEYLKQAQLSMTVPVKRPHSLRVTYISGNLREIPMRPRRAGVSCVCDESSQEVSSADSGEQKMLTKVTRMRAPVSLGAAEDVERVRIGTVKLAALTETGVVEMVRNGWREGKGGSIVTSNIHITQLASRDSETARLVDRATVTVADGMPLVWVSRLQGKPLPERITGCSLLFSLSQAAAEDGRSVFLLGGDPGVPEEAAHRLQVLYPGLRIAGTNSPPYGFEKSEEEVIRIVQETAATAPHLVFVGLGFPKQERLIERLREEVPDAWYLGCGSGIAFAARQRRRAPSFLQNLGLEWAYRLALEPRRLARRYLRYNLPFALRLLAVATASRRPSGRVRNHTVTETTFVTSSEGN